MSRKVLRLFLGRNCRYYQAINSQNTTTQWYFHDLNAYLNGNITIITFKILRVQSRSGIKYFIFDIGLFLYQKMAKQVQYNLFTCYRHSFLILLSIDITADPALDSYSFLHSQTRCNTQIQKAEIVKQSCSRLPCTKASEINLFLSVFFCCCWSNSFL